MLALPGRNGEERQEEIRLFQRVLCAGEKESSQRDKEAQQGREIGSTGRQAPNEDKAAKVALKDDTHPLVGKEDRCMPNLSGCGPEASRKLKFRKKI